MNTISFFTNTFIDKSFTTGFSYLTDKNGQPCFGEVDLFDDHVVCASSEHTFAFNALLEVSGFGKIMLKTKVLAANGQTVDLLNALIEGRIDQLNKELEKTSESIRNIYNKKIQSLIKKRTSHEKLALLLQIGEDLVLENARETLNKRIHNDETKDFLIG